MELVCHICKVLYNFLALDDIGESPGFTQITEQLQVIVDDKDKWTVVKEYEKSIKNKKGNKTDHQWPGIDFFI